MPASPDNTDLALVSTEALLGELGQRYDEYAFISRRRDAKGPGEHDFTVSWDGDPWAVAGLLQQLSRDILPDLVEADGDG